MTKAEKKAAKANRQTVKEFLKERIKNIPLTVLMALFSAFCIFSIVYFPVIGRWRDGLISFAYLCVVPLFYFAEKSLNMRVPFAYAVFLMAFVLFCHLGACFNFYYIIPCLDDILHSAWGIVFATVGIILIKSLMGPAKDAKAVIVYVLFGLGFAMLLSVAWEIWEYSGDYFIADMDMQQDTVVDHIHSFIMYPNPDNPAPDNLHTWQVNNIVRTIIIDADGNQHVIEGGYLDLGLYDTMMDLIYCFLFVAVFSIALAIDWCKGKFIYRFFIPALVSEVEERKSAKIAKNSVNSEGVSDDSASTLNEEQNDKENL